MDTQTLTGAGLGPLDVAPDRLFPISLDVFEGMVKHGLLTKSDKVELLDGLLVEKMTKGDPHATATLLVRDLLLGLGLKGWHVRTELPIAIVSGPTGRDSAPEPDVSLVRGAVRDYAIRKPRPMDVALVVEVAESSLRNDRAGLARYAWAAIPVAWIANLNDRTVEVYSNPTGPAAQAAYQDSKVYGPGELIPVVIDGREVGQIVVTDILP